MYWINTHCFCLLLRILVPSQLLLHAPHGPSCSYTPSWCGPSSHIWHTSSHMLGTVGACLWDVMFVVSLSWLLFGFWAILILSNCHNSVISFNMAACAICTSTLLAHTNTPSLVICSSLLLAVNSNITLSFNLWINCSLSSQSISPWLHSATATCNFPIHSSALSPLSLYNFLNCSDFIVSLHCSLNFVANVLNSPWSVLHASFCPSVRLLI